MEKTYINGTSCKEITGQYGSFFNISVKVEDLQGYANDKGYVNMTMSKRKEVGTYGDTHYFTLNEWKPNEDNRKNEETEETTTTTTTNNSNDISVEDLPF